MHAELETFNSGWVGIGIGLSATEIDTLVQRLIAIRDDPGHHFHFRSAFEGSVGVADVEFFLKSPDDADNMSIE